MVAQRQRGVRAMTSRRSFIRLSTAALACFVGAACLRSRQDNADVLRIASSIVDQGGYGPLSGTGVPEDVSFNGVTILRGTPGGFYCCGFTFVVALRSAEQR